MESEITFLSSFCKKRTYFVFFGVTRLFLLLAWVWDSKNGSILTSCNTISQTFPLKSLFKKNLFFLKIVVFDCGRKVWTLDCLGKKGKLCCFFTMISIDVFVWQKWSWLISFKETKALEKVHGYESVKEVFSTKKREGLCRSCVVTVSKPPSSWITTWLKCVISNKKYYVF